MVVANPPHRGMERVCVRAQKKMNTHTCTFFSARAHVDFLRTRVNNFDARAYAYKKAPTIQTGQHLTHKYK